MSEANKSLEVDPTELHLAAGQIEGHASDFMSTHHTVHAEASQVALAGGLASAALPAMLAAWEADGVRYGRHFAVHANGHREAATVYVTTDSDSAGEIDGAGSAL